MIFFIIVVAIVSVVLFISFIKFLILKSTCSKWKVGDLLYTPKYLKERKKENIQYVKLSGWNMSNVFIEIGSTVYMMDHSDIEFNKSCDWRMRYIDCKKTMKGELPTFKEEVINVAFDEYSLTEGVPTSARNMIEGKYIDSMSETECSIYLNIALNEEKFEEADAIKKRMEHFR